MDNILPHSIDAEQGLISAILVNPERLDDVLFIRPEMFYNDHHKLIYEHILDINNKNLKPDIITLKNSLESSGDFDSIGLNYLMELSETVVSDKLISQYAEIVKEKYLRRQYIFTGDELMRMSYETFIDIKEINNFAESSLFKITDQSIVKEPEQLSFINKETIANIKKIENQEIELTGVPSGIVQLDRITLGFQKTDLILIAARPSMGKTALSLSITREAAEKGYKILFFSLEMSKRQLSYRMLVDRFTEINDLRIGKNIDWDSINRMNGKYTSNIFIDDMPSLRAIEIRSIARKLKKKVDIDMIIIDYLQLARGDDRLTENGSRYVGDISKTFKAIAKELDIPVIAVSQLSRKVEDRSNPFPILSDLRESGELEQDADIVIFITRFRRLHERHWMNDKGEDMRDKAYIDVAKNRQGKCDKILTTASEDAMFWGY